MGKPNLRLGKNNVDILTIAGVRSAVGIESGILEIIISVILKPSRRGGGVLPF